MNSQFIYCLGHTFDMGIKTTLSASEIGRLSSQFLMQMCDPVHKDKINISALKSNHNTMSATININQQKRHPNSDDGFHFSAWPAADVAHRLALQSLGSSHDLKRFEICCKRSIRQHQFQTQITHQGHQYEYHMHDRAFFGILDYGHPLNQHLPKHIEAPPQDFAHHDRFSIGSFTIDGARAQVKIDFESDSPAPSGATLGPGLAIAIVSQAVIVHAYALCGIRHKKSGIVLKSFTLESHEPIPSPGSILIDINLGSIHKAHHKSEFVVIDCACIFAQGKARAKASYYFEPF